MGANYTITTRNAGDTLTAAIYNADHQNHIDNSVPLIFDDYSANLTQMQVTTDPGELSAEDLPTTLAGEIARLRYAIQDIKSYYDTSLTRWYQTPTRLSLALGTVATSIPVLNGTVTWNDAAVTFTALKVAVTSTASAAASLLLDLTVGGTSQAKITKAGLMTILGSLVAPSVGPNSAQVHTLPAVASDTVALLAATQTFTNKTLTSATLDTGVTISDGVNIVLGTSSGTKFGTATSQKIGFFNSTPATKRGAYTQTYSTADKTHAAFTSADLTGITSSTTGSALAEPSVAYVQAEIQQNFRRIQDQFVALRADVDDAKQLINAVIDDLQVFGFVA